MSRQLFLIKLSHTVIWFIYVLIISYILYSGIFDKINLFTWISIGLVIIEGIVLLIFNGKCPFTVAGYKYSEDHDVGFDIYLPKWLAKYNKLIFGTLFAIGTLLVLLRVLNK